MLCTPEQKQTQHPIASISQQQHMWIAQYSVMRISASAAVENSCLSQDRQLYAAVRSTALT
jgi:hypothetical protein